MQLTCGRWYLPNKDPVQCRYLHGGSGGGEDDGDGNADGVGEDDGEDDEHHLWSEEDKYFQLFLKERRQVPHQG